MALILSFSSRFHSLALSPGDEVVHDFDSYAQSEDWGSQRAATFGFNSPRAPAVSLRYGARAPEVTVVGGVRLTSRTRATVTRMMVVSLWNEGLTRTSHMSAHTRARVEAYAWGPHVGAKRPLSWAASSRGVGLG